MPLDVESIVESIEILDRELDEIRRQAKDGHLRAKPDETVSPTLGQKCMKAFSFLSPPHWIIHRREKYPEIKSYQHSTSSRMLAFKETMHAGVFS